MDSPSLAILFAALGDGFACMPIIRKAWQSPETETGLTFVMGFMAVLLVLPSMPKWNIANSAFQIYLLFANSIIIFAIYRRRLWKKLSGIY